MIKKIIYPLKYLYWSTKTIVVYIYNDISTWKDIFNHYYIFILISLLVLPWIQSSFSISVFADLLTYVSFVILLKDKYEYEHMRLNELEKIIEILKSDIDAIVELFIKYKIVYIDNTPMCLEYFSKEIRMFRDFNHFEDSRYSIISNIVEYLTKSYHEKDVLFCIKYFVFSEVHSKFRKRFIDEYFDKRFITNTSSKENKLLIILNEKHETNKINLLQNIKLSKERAEQIASIEFGEKINKKNIDIVIQDNNKYKKFKDIVTDAINKGLISDKSLDSITCHSNKLFIVIKYGEGTSLESWPVNVKAPFAQLLYENEFSNPFKNEYFTFIRDLNKNPINVSSAVFMKNILIQLKIQYKKLKKEHSVSEVIQNGPHYEIISFVIDRKSFNWFLSETRNFNSFMSQILLDDILSGDFNDEFLKINYYKIKKIINDLEWFSLLSNDDLSNDIKNNISNVNLELSLNNIILSNIYSNIQLDKDSIEIISKVLYKLFKNNKYSSANSKIKKIQYFKRLLTNLKKTSNIYSDIMNDFIK